MMKRAFQNVGPVVRNIRPADGWHTAGQCCFELHNWVLFKMLSSRNAWTSLMSLKKICFGTLGLSVPVVNRICENPSQAKPPFSEHSRATEHVCVCLHYRAVRKAARLCRGSPNRHQPIWRGDIFYHRCKLRLMEIYVSHTQKVSTVEQGVESGKWFPDNLCLSKAYHIHIVHNMIWHTFPGHIY